MNHLQAREFLEEGDVVIVNSDTQCNVMIMTDSEYRSYQSGQRFHYFGGHFKMFPARIVVPHTDDWNVTIDLGGGAANIRYSINYLKRS